MKRDTVILYVMATIFSGCLLPAMAFVTNTQSKVQSTSNQRHQYQQEEEQQRQQQQQQQLNNVAADLMGFPDATIVEDGTPRYITTGSVSFRPHNSEEVNERSVYDPGDELLRALNAELTANINDPGTEPQASDYAETVSNDLEIANKYDMLRAMENELKEEQDIVSKSAILMKFLEDPSLETLPIVYIEEQPAEEPDNALYPSTTGMEKRSRYYRRYPWKRHNRNRNYEPELRYACTPSKEDVFKLLLGLHENRQGNHQKTVQFCNRKRPAKAIFTNIRFLG